MVTKILLIILSLGGEPAQIFNYGFGARSFGMGGAYSTQYCDLASVYFNPANISLLDQQTFSVGYTQLMEDLNITYAAVGRVTTRGINYGFYALGLNTPGFEVRDEDNRYRGVYDFLEIGGAGVIGKRLLRYLYGGVSLKLYYGRIAEFTASGFGLDAGLISTYFSKVITSFTLKNLIPMTIKFESEKERAPLGIRFGLAWKPIPEFVLSGDLDYNSYSGVKAYMGGEGKLLNILYLRGGYDGSFISAGIGVEKSFGDKLLRLDYTYSMSLTNLVFEEVHHINLTYAYGGYRVYAEADRKHLDISEEGGLAWILIHARTRSDVKNWKLIITNKDGEKVKEFGGKGTPPLRVAWDGRDETGRIVVEGKYYYELIVEDEDGAFYTKKGKLIKVRIAL